MFGTLLEKEIKVMLQSKQFVISFLVIMSLVLLSFVVGIQNYKNAVLTHEQSQSEYKLSLKGIKHWPMVKPEISLPPDPLHILVSGISNDVGRQVDVQSSSSSFTPINSRYGDNTMLAIFRAFDLEFMFSVVLSLFAIVFTFAAINGEREQGTLSLLFSNALKRSQFILAKTVGVLLALIIPMLIAVLMGLILLPLFGVQLRPDDWSRIGLIILLGIAHVSFFAIIGVASSAVFRSSSTSFLALLVFWIASVFLVPRTAVLLAGRSVEIPSNDEIQAQKSRLRTQLWIEDKKKMSNFEADETGDVQIVMQQFQKMMSDLSDERTKKVNQFAKKMEEDFQNKSNLRDQLSKWLARLSPTAAFKLAVNELASAGTELPKQFRTAAKQYKFEFDRFLELKSGSKGSGFVMIIQDDDDDDEPESIDTSEMPFFEFKKAGIAHSLDSFWIGLSILGFFNVMAFWMSVSGFVKADIK